MATKNVLFTIDAHAKLTSAVAGDIADAINAGMSKEDVAAVLTRFVELLESDE